MRGIAVIGAATGAILAPVGPATAATGSASCVLPGYGWSVTLAAHYTLQGGTAITDWLSYTTASSAGASGQFWFYTDAGNDYLGAVGTSASAFLDFPDHGAGIASHPYVFARFTRGGQSCVARARLGW
jgi:hypothetical protein